MDTRQNHGLPARLEGVRQRFERWRGTHQGRSRIPEPLWQAAVKMADKYGLHRTAKALRVDYYALKKRGEQGSAAASGMLPAPEEGESAVGSPATTFVELASPVPAGACQCTLELENAAGAKMRVHLTSRETPDLSALSRSFWNPAP